MGFHAECGRGWSARCAKSKGKKCRCRCGGANHGKSAPTFELNLNATEREARFTVVDDADNRLVIRDVGPWDKHPTVTNDAKGVVARLAARLGGRRLFYYDSSGQQDELLVRDGRFAGYAPGGLMVAHAASRT